MKRIFFLGILFLWVFVSFSFADEPIATSSNHSESSNSAAANLNQRKKDCELKKKASPGCWEWKTNEHGIEECVSVGIILNTNVPGIGKCIKYHETGNASTAHSTTVNQITAFPTLIGKLVSLLTSVLLLIGFVMILVAGVMMTTGGIDPGNYKKGKELIFKV